MKKFLTFLAVMLMSLTAINAEDLYLRGGVNSWNASADYKFTDNGDGTFTLNKTFDLEGQFKFADANWGDVLNFGSNEQAKCSEQGTTINLVTKGNNISTDGKLSLTKIVVDKNQKKATFYGTTGAASDAVYTIAGQNALMGADWDPSATANDMTDMKDGTYKLVKENVSLAVGDYEYKAVKNHAWGIWECPSSGNNKLTISEAGTYTVTFTLTPDKSTLTGNAVKSGEPQPVETKYYVTGNAALCGEKAWNAKAIEMTEGAYTFPMLAVGDYQLKVTDGTWDNSWGYSDLSKTVATEGLTTDKDNNICFTVYTPNDVTITISEGHILIISGNFKPAPVTEPSVTEIAIAGDKYVGTELTFTATVAGFSAEPTVIYEVKAQGGEYTQAQGGKFTPTVAGDYTAKATATYIPDEGDAEEAFKEVEFTVTEKPVKEYYLVGWINGANSGCEDDYESLHAEYKFVNNQLTVTFTEASYVFVKTSDNSHWFLSESYVAPAAKVTATLLEGKSEKVGVNPNVEVTFTLTENVDGTLTLSYEEPVITYKDSVYYVAGNFTNWAAEMKKLPASVELPADSALEFKQVLTRTVLADGDSVRQDTIWYGQANEGNKMTRESSAWTLDGGFNVLATTDLAGTYTFSLNDKGEFVLGWPKEPVKEYYITGNAALCGEKAWDAQAIEMTDSTHTFMAMAAGEYEMKITNGAWDPEGQSWGSAALSENCSAGVDDKGGNIHFIVETPNNVVVSIANGKVTVTGTFKESPVGTGITVNVTVPDGTPACYFYGEMSGNTFVEMDKVDDTHYTTTFAKATSIGWGYKFVWENGNWSTCNSDPEGDIKVEPVEGVINVEVKAWATAPGTKYEYTKYEEWQVKFGPKWEWVNMTKQEDGTFTLSATWGNTGINIASGTNPIKKDWYPLDDAALTVDAGIVEGDDVTITLTVVDDETVSLHVSKPTSPTALEAIMLNGGLKKFMLDGQMYILRNNHLYNAAGNLLK